MDRRYLYLGISIVALIAVAGVGAIHYTNDLESSIRKSVQTILQEGGFTDVDVLTDGTNVTLSGSVATIAEREQAFRLVQNSKISSNLGNRITVIPVGQIAEDVLELDIQNTGEQVILSGEIPSKIAQFRLVERAQTLVQDGTEVMDLLITRDREGFNRFVDAAFAGLEAVEKLAIGQVRIDETSIVVSGEATTAEQHQAAQATLERLKPDGYKTSFDVEAPLPTISPYIFSISQDNGVYALETCYAPNTNSKRRIVSDLVKLTDLPKEVESECILAIGQPNVEWNRAISAGLQALKKMSSGQLYIVDSQITLTGFARENANPVIVSDQLNQTTPSTYILKTSIKPWYPVVEPYTLIIKKVDGQVQFVNGNAPSQGVVDKLFMNLGLSSEGKVKSVIQLARGTPENWQVAVNHIIDVVENIPIVQVLFEDKNITLRGNIDSARQRIILTNLSQKLPDGYTIRFEDETGANIDEQTVFSPYNFTVSTQAQSNDIILEGQFPDNATQKALLAYATAALSSNKLVDKTEVSTVQGSLEKNWFAASTGAIDIFQLIENGNVRVENNKIYVEGQTLEVVPAEKLQQTLSDDVLEDFKVESRLIVRAPTQSTTSPEICIQNLNDILAANPIQFASGDITIGVGSRETIRQLAEVYTQCTPQDVEIGGYTDNTGTPEINMDLSFRRARSVLEAMIEAGASPVGLTAVGYGSASPVAPNNTSAGRRQNRRFEFKLKE